MANIRAVVTLPYWTAIPEDVSSNTFHFSTVGPVVPATDGPDISDRLLTFYQAIDSYISPVVQASGWTIKCYDMADPEPRVPFFQEQWGAMSLASTGLPEEVAVCLSYAAAPVSGGVAARYRGRIFIGPLGTNVLTNGTTAAFSNVLAAARSAIGNAAANLADLSETPQWCLWSETDQVMRQIVSGWIDNAFDTQRRRGRRPSVRSTWVAVP